MATFYLLPSRIEMRREWGKLFRHWFPGLPEPGPEFPDLVAQIVAPQPGIRVVFADDLPDHGHIWEALVDGFGACPGDQMIDVRSGRLRLAA
jgi:hypothetical protein